MWGSKQARLARALNNLIGVLGEYAVASWSGVIVHLLEVLQTRDREGYDAFLVALRDRIDDRLHDGHW